MLWHRLSGGRVTQIWVDYDHIAKSAKQAAIASEDGKFVAHYGFDFDSIQKAMHRNESQGAVSVGGSTISQQLAKTYFDIASLLCQKSRRSHHCCDDGNLMVKAAYFGGISQCC